MKRLKCCVVLLLSLVFGLSGVLQPFALYAETLDLAQEEPKVSQPATESASNASTNTSGDQVESDSAAQDSSTPDSSEATDAEATSDEDSNKGTDEASDEASDADVVAPLAENSWRYVDGSLRSDLPDDYGANADFDGRAMHSMPKGATAQGIDVSEHNGTINWQSVKDAGIDFAILRVGFAGDTSGGRLDNYFKRNVSECERLGIPYGVYLYSYARNEDEAQAEARLMLSALKGHSPALPVYYDLEERKTNADGSPMWTPFNDPSKLASIAKTFCGQIAAAGYKPGIYANVNWFKNYLTDPCFLSSGWSIWTAQYWYGGRYDECLGLTPDAPAKYDCWQYSARGSVPGVSGDVDVNYWFREGLGDHWEKTEDGVFYLSADGQPYKGERRIGGKWYHFDEETGAMSTGFTKLEAKTVYYLEDGPMAYGERRIDGKWYHFDEVTGAMSTGFTRLASKTVLYGEDGAMLYGRQEYRGKVYYLDPADGSLRTSGWVSDGGSRCYLLPSGELAKGERRIGGKWYHFDEETGAMSTGFTKLEAKTVYYLEDGPMAYGERRIDGKWYHFDEVTGAMSTGFTRLASKTVLYGEDGAMLYGRQEYRGKVYYLDPADGSLRTSGWVSLDCDSYGYLGSDGSVSLVRKQAQDGSWYLLDLDGVILKGWVRCGSASFYCDPITGTLTIGQRLIDNHWYDFDDSGVMQIGFVKLTEGTSSKWVYYGDDGKMLYGEQLINGHWYYLNKTTGAVTYGWLYLDSGQKWVWYGPEGGNGQMRYGHQIVDGVQRYFDPVTGACDKIGYQNPAGYFQVSTRSVNIPHLGQGKFGYRTPSRISIAATRQDCINAMIARAYDYVGTTPYIWDYSCAPGVGVDCAGLVMQCLYATGMDLGRYTPWDHYYTPGHDHYANDMWNDSRFKHLDFSQRQRGDLICYNGHIAIYIGNDQIIEAASPRIGVRIHSVYVGYPIKGVLRPFV